MWPPPPSPNETLPLVFTQAHLDDTFENVELTAHIVTNIDYNARGRRLLIAYGNGSTTDYEYDARSFRVT